MSMIIPNITAADILIARNYGKEWSLSEKEIGLIPYFEFGKKSPKSYYGSFEEMRWSLDDVQEMDDEQPIEFLTLEKLDRFATDEASIRKGCDEFDKILSERQDEFCIRLRRTDFEDGYDNDIIDEVKSYMETNKYVTTNWLNKIYSSNQRDPAIISGLLRVIGSVASGEEIKAFIPLIKCGLQDSHVECQEAALMAIEVLGTKECIDAIETVSFTSPLIKGYAEAVLESLKESLGYATEDVR